MKKSLIQILIVFLLLSITSCQPVNDIDFTGHNIPISEMNTAFRINDLDVFENSRKNGEIIVLRAENLGKVPLTFAGNAGVKIFTQKDGNWIKVDNRMSSSNTEMILPLKTEFPAGILFNVAPYISDIKKTTTIRIVIVGDRDGNHNDYVGAYIDIPLLP